MRAQDNTDLSPCIWNTLRRLHEKGVELWADAGQLRFKAPYGALTEEDIDQLKASRAQVVAFLGSVTAIAPSARVPLSFSQLWRWHLFNLQDRPSSRVVTRAFRLSGRLNIAIFQRSLQNLVDTHQALCTRIQVLDGVPTQFVVDEGDCGRLVEDLSDVPEGVRETAVRQLIERCSREPVDMSAMPLWDVRVLRLREEENVLVLALDHMISDARSMEILLGDLLEGYARLLRGRAWRDSPAPSRFTDYALWQRGAQQGLFDQHGDYWMGRLRGWQFLRFPADKAVPRRSRGWASLSFCIGRTLKGSLCEWSRKNKTSLAVGILTAYVGLLSRWCETSDVLIQCQTHGRPSPDFDDTVGYFASLIGLRISVGSEDSLVTLLSRVTQEYCKALDRGDSSYMATQIARGEFVRNGIFNWIPRRSAQQMTTSADGRSDLNVHPIDFEQTALNDLAWENDPEIQLLERDEEIVAQLYFPQERFTTDTMQRLVASFLMFLESLLEQPEMPVGKLALAAGGGGIASVNDWSPPVTGRFFHADPRVTAGGYSPRNL